MIFQEPYPEDFRPYPEEPYLDGFGGLSPWSSAMPRAYNFSSLSLPSTGGGWRGQVSSLTIKGFFLLLFPYGMCSLLFHYFSHRVIAYGHDNQSGAEPDVAGVALKPIPFGLPAKTLYFALV